MDKKDYRKKSTAARTRAKTKYNKEAYDSILIRVPKGEKDKIADFALLSEESLNGFVWRVIKEAMKREEK